VQTCTASGTSWHSSNSEGLYLLVNLRELNNYMVYIRLGDDGVCCVSEQGVKTIKISIRVQQLTFVSTDLITD